jgi:ABC-type amino acid transport substrate-binding protein
MARSLVFAVVGLTAALAAPCAGADALPLAGRTPLRVLVYPEKDRSEFFSLDDREPGFEREILEGFARAQKMPMEVVAVSKWEALIPDLTEGRGDVIAGHFTDTEERRLQVDFTTGLMPTRIVIINRKPAAPVGTLKQLQNERVGAVKGTAAYDELVAAGVPKTKIDDTITFENMLEALRSGRVSALARSVPLAVLSQRDDPEIQIGMFVGDSTSFSFGVRKSDTSLREMLNQHIALLNKTGQWNRLVVKYFGPAAVDILKKAQTQAAQAQ